MVIDDIPRDILLPGENEPDPFLRCSTISELYEKIDALWNEYRYSEAAFLIKYDDQRHYPTNIRFRNINDKGSHDYRVVIYVYESEGTVVTKWWGTTSYY
jgi:hypothetical protein